MSSLRAGPHSDIRKAASLGDQRKYGLCRIVSVTHYCEFCPPSESHQSISIHVAVVFFPDWFTIIIYALLRISRDREYTLNVSASCAPSQAVENMVVVSVAYVRISSCPCGSSLIITQKRLGYIRPRSCILYLCSADVNNRDTLLVLSLSRKFHHKPPTCSN